MYFYKNFLLTYFSFLIFLSISTGNTGNTNLSDIRDSDGNTPIMQALLYQHINPQRQEELITYYINQDADLTLKNKSGDTAFTLACSMLNIHIIKLLLAHNAHKPLSKQEILQAYSKARKLDNPYSAGFPEKLALLKPLIIQALRDIS